MLKQSAAVSLIGEHVRPVAGNSRSSSSNNNITATVGAEGVAVGDTAVVSVATGTFAGAVGCSDTKGNAYTVVADKNTGQGRLFTCSSTLATALGTGDVVTATYPGFSGLSVVSVNKILAYTTTGATDGVSTASGSNPPVNSGTINTAHAADLLFGVVAHTSPSTFTPGSGFQIVGQVSGGSGSGKKTVSPMFKAVYSIGPYSRDRHPLGQRVLASRAHRISKPLSIRTLIGGRPTGRPPTRLVGLPWRRAVAPSRLRERTPDRGDNGIGDAVACPAVAGEALRDDGLGVRGSRAPALRGARVRRGHRRRDRLRGAHLRAHLLPVLPHARKMCCSCRSTDGVKPSRPRCRLVPPTNHRFTRSGSRSRKSCPRRTWRCCDAGSP